MRAPERESSREKQRRRTRRATTQSDDASMRVSPSLLLQLLAPAVGAGGPLLPGMAWNSWNTFSVNGKPLRSGREGYQQIAEVLSLIHI